MAEVTGLLGAGILCTWIAILQLLTAEVGADRSYLDAAAASDSGGGTVRRRVFTGVVIRCGHSADCMAYNALCSNRTRTCFCPRGYGYSSNTYQCVQMGRTPDNVGIYQVTLVVAAVFMVVVFAVFVACVVKRTCERSRELAERMRELTTDVYTVPAEFAGLEKPPSYTEIVEIDNMIYGVPPPEYSAVGAEAETEQGAASSLPPPSVPLSAVALQASRTSSSHSTPSPRPTRPRWHMMQAFADPASSPPPFVP